MDIYFSCAKLQKACNLEQESIKKWGPEIAKKVRQRLSELKAADSLSDISHLPPPRLHELTGERKGRFAVDLQQPFRLVFEPAHDPIPLNGSGGIDRSKITAILINGVEDYHGKKKKRRSK
ncbi:type II toxin-antitoxin system RelE/ParE family toxin [Desulfocucumis palustris]|uniref:type II toxin-antitoxin system RelE/ParE family toxin n=1 Tax=Desulfocucumis palustris TaxID=1898651 RepID=UPI000CEA18B6|nr:killer suppression protein [Desulfocucumis palustris]